MLDPIVSDFEALADDLKSFYSKAEDGKGIIHDKLRPVLDSVTSLNEVVKKERKLREQAEKAAKSFADLGETPDAIKERLTGLQQAVEEKTTGARVWEKHKAELEDAYKKQLTERDAKLSSLEKALHNSMIKTAAIAAIEKAGGSSVLLMPHLEAHARVTQQDGTYVVQIVDAEGDQRYTNGKPMDFSALLEDLRTKPEFQPAFKASGSGGTGQTTQNRGGGGGGRQYTLQDWQSAVMLAKPEERTKMLADKAAGRIVVVN
jgi:hypothetical protein